MLICAMPPMDGSAPTTSGGGGVDEGEAPWPEAFVHAEQIEKTANSHTGARLAPALSAVSPIAPPRDQALPNEDCGKVFGHAITKMLDAI
jgi:hypothetical protein